MRATTRRDRLFFGAGGITIVMVLLSRSVLGHFEVLVADKPARRAGEPVRLTYYRGHPFECEILDTEPPERVAVLKPDGKTWVDLKPSPKKVDNFDGGQATVQTLRYTPTERGDHLVALTTKMRFDAHEAVFTQQHLRLTLHVQAQWGWDHVAGLPLELVPLTRPYGLEPGFVVKAQARLGGKPVADAVVEIEKYHARPPKNMPSDDALITRAVKTDVNGYVVATLDEPGWWMLCVTVNDGTKLRDGKPYPVRRQGFLWLYVDPKTDTVAGGAEG